MSAVEQDEPNPAIPPPFQVDPDHVRISPRIIAGLVRPEPMTPLEKRVEYGLGVGIVVAVGLAFLIGWWALPLAVAVGAACGYFANGETMVQLNTENSARSEHPNFRSPEVPSSGYLHWADIKPGQWLFSYLTHQKAYRDEKRELALKNQQFRREWLEYQRRLGSNATQAPLNEKHPLYQAYCETRKAPSRHRRFWQLAAKYQQPDGRLQIVAMGGGVRTVEPADTFYAGKGVECTSGQRLYHSGSHIDPVAAVIEKLMPLLTTEWQAEADVVSKLRKRHDAEHVRLAVAALWIARLAYRGRNGEWEGPVERLIARFDKTELAQRRPKYCIRLSEAGQIWLHADYKARQPISAGRPPTASEARQITNNFYGDPHFRGSNVGGTGDVNNDRDQRSTASDNSDEDR